MNANIELVKQGYQYFLEGNISGILNLVHDDCTWTEPGFPDIPYSGRFTTKAEIAAFFSGYSENFITSRFEPQHFWADGDTVISRGVFEGTAINTGTVVSDQWVMVFRIVDGKIKDFQQFYDTNKTAKALQQVPAEASLS
jgi:uncharacterized protein